MYVHAVCTSVHMCAKSICKNTLLRSPQQPAQASFPEELAPVDPVVADVVSTLRSQQWRVWCWIGGGGGCIEQLSSVHLRVWTLVGLLKV